MKVCGNCRKEKTIDEFNVKKGNLRQSYCKDCQKILKHLWYLNNREKVISLSKNRKIVNQQFILRYLQEHPCVDCGEIDVVVLEFDHQRDKTANVTVMVREGWSLESIINEISKCEVVCANCHKRRTYKGSYRYGPLA